MAPRARPRELPIGALSRDTGTRVETIRYYERIGLLPPPARTRGNQRRYGEGHARRLAFVRHARDLGISIASLRALLTLSDAPGMPCDEAHAIAAAHLADVRGRIARLRALEDELARIASGCAGGGTAGECGLIEALADHGRCGHGHGREILDGLARHEP